MAQTGALQQLQAAASAQQNAIEEEARLERLQREVAEKEKEVAQAKANLRAQRAKAQLAQQDALEAARAATRRAEGQQRLAIQRLQSAGQKPGPQRLEKWTKTQTVNGTVLGTEGESVRVRDASNDQVLTLHVSKATAVSIDGDAASVRKLAPGTDVRATYQTIDDRSQAIRIEAGSKQVTGDATNGNPPRAPR